jgi:tetrahydromethanopterin S-methyltransferase subunit B
MNDINGTRQAIIKYAEGNFQVSGEPDSADKSDVLNALLKIIENVFGRVPTVTRGPFVADINYARRYQLFFIGNIAENAKIFLPDISTMGGVDVIEIEIFNTSSLYLKVIVYPESELLNLPPGGWVRIRPFPTSGTSSVWGHSYHYKENITPNAAVKYDIGGRLQAARPVLDDHVLRLGDRDIYAYVPDFTDIYEMINEIKARTEALENATAQNITRNSFFITFPNLDGVELISGAWNKAKGTLECTYGGFGINIIFTNLFSVDLISGIWNRGEGTVEC